MDNKLIITKQKQMVISSLFEENELVQINVEPDERTSLLGNIYVGKVKNIIKNINAAFVEIEEGMMCYLSLTDNENPIFSNPKNDSRILMGDEIIVQVTKENIKTKQPAVSTNLNFTGKYVVLTHGKTTIGVSNKIEDEDKCRQLKKIAKPYSNTECGFILRTNAVNAEKEMIVQEIQTLLELYNKVKTFGIHKQRFSCVYRMPVNYICDIRDSYTESFDKIVTDDPMIFEEIKAYLSDYQRVDLDKLHFHEDRDISLNSLYGINSKLENALKEKVWLKSGASLVIQPTEALTAIDVNTGKAITGKKKVQETFLRVNLEAAREIAKQIRLRNLSGIIIIDFIDMISQEQRDLLMEELRKLLHKDPIRTNVIDMTALNLVEITRKKVRKPLYEQYQRNKC